MSVLFGGEAMTDPYENVANAIVAQAAKDYRKALLKLSRRPYHEQANIDKAEIEGFFLSEWFLNLTKSDGQGLMTRIQGEVKEFERQRLLKAGIQIGSADQFKARSDSIA